MKTSFKYQNKDALSIGFITLAVIFIVSAGVYSTVNAEGDGSIRISCFGEKEAVSYMPGIGCPLPQTLSITCPAEAPHVFYEKDALKCMTEANFAPKNAGGNDIILCSRLGKQTYNASLYQTNGCFKDDTPTGCPFGSQPSGSTCLFDSPSATQTQATSGMGAASQSNVPMVKCMVDYMGTEYLSPVSIGCYTGARPVKCPKGYVKGKKQYALTCVEKKKKK